ncbi:MAG: MBL fold metallo-hydrolase [Microlunatus sp.]|nr:MBL fold metallo-hydrolase [Microlunatus sp.]MDN5770957.1 MBL fold metallo-hydrolase [Microlunatus sp.]MDN5803366.1 MBL fold metallo-hydrolase [Microlunatus sp.]
MSQRPNPFTAVAEHVYTCELDFEDAEAGATGSVTVGLVVGTERALLVDSGATPEQGRLLRQAAAEVAERPVEARDSLAVVLTHWHLDHTFGLAGVDATVAVAHESVRARLAGPKAAAEAARWGIDPAEVALPTRDLAVAWTIDLGGGVRVEAVHLGRGHTEGDLLVVVPGSDVVFAGDLIESAGPPSYGPDSFPHEWPSTLDGLVGLMTDATLAVPGHGAPVKREFVLEQLGRVAAVSGEISRLAGLGVDPGDAEERADWAFPFACIRPGLAAGFAQARGSGRRSLPLA